MMADPQPRRWAVDTKNGLTGSLSWSNTGTQLTSFTGAKRNKCTLVVLVLVLEVMKKRALRVFWLERIERVSLHKD